MTLWTQCVDTLRRLHRDEQGASMVEYMMLLAVVGVPCVVLFRGLMNLMTAHYGMVVFMETLPMP